MILNVQCTPYKKNAVITMFYRGYSIKILDVPCTFKKKNVWYTQYIFSVYCNKLNRTK